VRASRAAVVLIAIAAPIAAAAAIAGCDQGTPARPDSPVVEAGAQDVTVVICPELKPNFNSIRTGLLDTNSCGATRGGKCHSSDGAQFSGGLDYTADASALYAEFLGDGGGAIAQNVGNVNNTKPGLRRVVPDDADASFLIIKLRLQAASDPDYGTGMPFDHPGVVCPTSVQAVADWIDNGAKFTEPDAEADDGAVDDARSDGGDAAD
jgi:hypothetical protein